MLFDRGDWTPHLPLVPDGGSTLPTPLGMRPFFFAVLPMGQGMHAYLPAYGPLSIRDGTPEQFPLYETVLLGPMWALPAIALLTVLAAVGALNVAFLAYNLIAFVWLPGDTAAQMPPWLTP